MTRGHLAVRINDGTADRHITRDVSGLRFRKTAPGGFAGGSMRINRPLSEFPGLGPADKVYVYDARTGDTVMEGYTENPGATDGPGGQSFDLSFLGNTILASDESRGLSYIDRDLGGWEKIETGVTSAIAEQATDPTAVDPRTGLRLAFGRQAINTGNSAQIGFPIIGRADMEVGAVHFLVKSGKTDAGYQLEMIYAGPSLPAGILNIGSGISTGFVAINRWVGDNFPTGVTRFVLNLRRVGAATNVVDENTWTWVTDVAVLSRRMNRYGVAASSSTDMVTSIHVRADWVVEDLLGRVLTMRDPVLSVVEPTTFEIDQLAFPDGTTAAGVVDALSLYEPDMLWEVLHSTPRGVVFRYRRWPTTARYEVSVRDGYSAPGGEYDLCNRIAVYWTDPTGAKQVKIVTSVVPELGSRIKDAESVTLPDGQGSERNAVQLGQQVLAAKNRPPKAGRITIRRPVFDRLRGRDVMPWEIEPGYLLTVREAGDTLRMTEVEYDDDQVEATVTLGEPELSLEQRVARLAKVRR